MRTSIVIGLGFGDEGKGITTDFLCSQSFNSIVIRFCGGQQAGHTVIKDGIKHIHANYGSGTLRNVPSYFSEHTSVYLNTLANETEVLKEKGFNPILYVNPLAKLTTPYDVAYNRLTEKKHKHGSCGMGIAATMRRNIETGYKLHAVDLLCLPLLKEKLSKIRQYYRDIITDSPSVAEYYKLLSPIESIFYENIEKNLFKIKNYSFLESYNNLVFEGSQGIMLDMNHGIFPNVTYANTTSKNALEIISQLNHRKHIDPEIYYVTRCYQTRHGRGWMSNQQPLNLINNEEEININNEWQEGFKIGEIDYGLINHALNIDEIYSYRVGMKNLVVTCLDQRPGFTFDYDKLNRTFMNVYESRSPQTNFKQLEDVSVD